MIHPIRAIQWCWFDLRSAVGEWFLGKALRFMPASYSVREGIERGLREQRAYDRYAGYTLACGGAPWSFEKWREAYRWIHMARPASRCAVRDTSHIHLIRERVA